MKVPTNVRPLLLALIAMGTVGSDPAKAVRVNADGHGQALIYPYYTARSAASSNSYVTALSVTNISPNPKALKVRFLERKVGAEVFDLNLFLAAHDVWTAGIVNAGSGAGIFTSDHSCTLPRVSNSASIPTKFRNGAYVGDLVGDSLDRTYEGYFEVLEMGEIDPESPLGLSITHTPDLSTPNASRPSCAGLPATDTVPEGLSKSIGGLVGNVSYINVGDGTEYSVDAVALAQWSDRVQWSAAGNPHPNLADASPAVSYVVDSREDSDLAYISIWSSGRDAVTALFMVNRVRNDYTVEPAIKAATDWLLTLPTKRFYVSAARSDPPFGSWKGITTDLRNYWCEVRFEGYDDCETGFYDREGQGLSYCIIYAASSPVQLNFCGAASVQTFGGNFGSANVSHVFASTIVEHVSLDSTKINGWYDFWADSAPASRLVGAPGATTIINTTTGQVTSGATVTYFGLPIIGFAAESFANGTLVVGGARVLSNYGGQFNHKFTKRIEVAP